MPLELDSRDRRSLAIAGGVFVLLILVALVLAPDTDSARAVPTTYSSASGGAKAAWLLLRQAGYHVERWERPPASLPNAANTVLVLADPSTYPTKEDREALRAFLGRGGRIVATGLSAAILFFQDEIVPDMPTGTWKQVPAVSVSAITRAAPRITLLPAAHWTGSGHGVPMYGDETGARVLARRVGKGELILWASATPLTNAGVTEPDNLEFLLACLGPRGTARILWDEYFHGYRQSLAASAVRSPLRWLFLHLGIVALAIVFTYSRRHGPLLAAPAAQSRLSPLEFVRTLGNLYERAGANSAAVDAAYSRFRYWITRRLGVPADAPVAAIEAAVRARYDVAGGDLRQTLAACESARTRQDLKPKEALRLVRALHRCGAALHLFARGRQDGLDRMSNGGQTTWTR